VIGAFEAARPYLLTLAGISLATGFYLVYFRKARCAPGSSCATDRPSAGVGTQAALWLGVVAAVALALFPFYSGAMASAASGGNSGGESVTAGSADAPADTLVYRVEGMTCGGCEAAVRGAVGNLPGVESVRASHEKEKAWIAVGSNEPGERALLEAIESAGFSATPLSTAKDKEHGK
jgi:copper chaperone CopZ